MIVHLSKHIAILLAEQLIEFIAFLQAKSIGLCDWDTIGDMESTFTCSLQINVDQGKLSC